MDTPSGAVALPQRSRAGKGVFDRTQQHGGWCDLLGDNPNRSACGALDGVLKADLHQPMRRVNGNNGGRKWGHCGIPWQRAARLK
jgi:hypothetical protein